MDHVEYAYTCAMDADAIEERLHASETGVLSLSRDNDAYAIPLAHYYDDEALYFRFGLTDTNTKREFLETTETACYVLYDTELTDDPDGMESWSVHITGRLVTLPQSEYGLVDTAEINRRFSPIRVFDEAIEDIEIAIVKLEIDTMNGRATTSD